MVATSQIPSQANITNSSPNKRHDGLNIARGAFALNNKLKIENSFPKSSIENLSNLGHDIEVVDEGIGGGQGIMIDRKEGVLIGGSDPRKDGLAIGY